MFKKLWFKILSSILSICCLALGIFGITKLVDKHKNVGVVNAIESEISLFSEIPENAKEYSNVKLAKEFLKLSENLDLSEEDINNIELGTAYLYMGSSWSAKLLNPKDENGNQLPFLSSPDGNALIHRVYGDVNYYAECSLHKNDGTIYNFVIVVTNFKYVIPYDVYNPRVIIKATTALDSIVNEMNSKENPLYFGPVTKEDQTSYNAVVNEEGYDIDLNVSDNLVLEQYFVDGSLYLEYKRTIGSDFSFPNAPDKEGYSFVRWEQNNSDSALQQDTIFTAVYKVKECIVYFVTDSTCQDILFSYITNYGSEITYPEAPQKDGYRFVEWLFINGSVDNPLSPIYIKGNSYFVAVYTEIKTITLLNCDGSIIDTIVVDNNSDFPVLPTPTFEDYVFIGWDKEIPEKVINNIELVAVYKQKVYYKYLDFDDTLIKEIRVNEGDPSPEFPEAPNRVGYTFVGWELVEFNQNQVYKATYKINQYIVKFIDFGSVIKEELLDYGSNYPEFPIVEHYGYEFIGWVKNNDNDKVECETVFTAEYQKIEEINVKIVYWSLERIDFSEDKSILGFLQSLGDKLVEFWNGSKANRFSDVLVRRTKEIKMLDKTELNFDEIIGNGLYGNIAYNNIPGWTFLNWSSTNNTNIVSKDNCIFTAEYNIPDVQVKYYSSNGVNVYNDTLKVDFVPIPEIERNITFWDGFTKYWNDIVVNWDIGAVIDDATSRDLAKAIAKGLSSKYIQDEQELYFMVIRPNVKIEEAYGLFKESGALCTSSTFKYLMGQAKHNDFVYFAELTPVYVSGINYEMVVTYDTPYDKALIGFKNFGNALKSFFGSVGKFFKNIWNGFINFMSKSWWIILIILGTGGIGYLIYWLVKRNIE